MIDFDFTTDTPNYWNNYWDFDTILGNFNNDPDSCSATMKKYQKILWSKKLPNGEILNLQYGKNNDYLIWKNFRFGSDCIIASFRYKNYRYMIEKVSQNVNDWHSFIENYIKKSYSIGGEIIFPKFMGGINQTRGYNPLIKDRFDLTLECIRLYYNGKGSPLYNCLMKNKNFFDLFVNFKGYVDFFFLQDLVSKDYKKVLYWNSIDAFNESPLPKNVEDYLTYIKSELSFVNKRNQRIKQYLQENNIEY